MILIDAIYINNGGGKILLDYLIEELEKKDIEVHYLLDRRIKKGYNVKRSNRITYLDSGILKRIFFYQKFKSNFTYSRPKEKNASKLTGALFVGV